MQIVKKHIQKTLNKPVKSISPISTGVNLSFRAVLLDDSEVFVKYQTKVNDWFIKEAKELKLLGRFVATPDVLFADDNILILSWLKLSNTIVNQSKLAQSLARLHQQIMPYFGFEFDNKIGSVKQCNAVGKNITNWADFYWQYRLLYQIELAYKKALISNNNYQKLLTIKNKLPKLITIDIKPVLLHGDLWSGNILSANNEPYFIDSACYYGHSEADLALSYMFGSFDNEFYQAYNNIHPKQDGFELRKPLYMLYHYLNHLNIFGNSYLANVNYYTEFILTS